MQNTDCAYSAGFFAAFDTLIAESETVIDRPRGTRHPKYPDFVYRIDYGYLKDTSSMDCNGIDVFRGSKCEATLDAVAITVDLTKRDSEIKLLVGCTDEDIRTVMEQLNESSCMKATLVKRG